MYCDVMLRDLHQSFKVNLTSFHCYFIQQESLHQSKVQSLIITSTMSVKHHYIILTILFIFSESNYLLSSESIDIQ